MQDYLNQLNEAQQKAVINYKGPSLIIAGAGSGKTRVLSYRIAHLLQNGVKPWRILALTFTNKAAKEMKERIATLIGEDKVRSLWMGTFHSIFAKFLRKEAEALGYPSSYTIYDTVDTKSILRTIVKELQLDDKIYKVNSVYGRISGAKNNLITAAVYENNKQVRITDENSRKPELYRIYKIYTERCKRSGAMDFDDLLLNTNILFKQRPDILEKYQNKFDYILVDEYQDTNFSQYLIIKKLAEQHRNICVVGDDAQSIYSFRGAKIENILKFQDEYKNHKLFKLEQNYRSTKNIVDAANSVIEKNKNRIKKEVFSKNEDGSKIKLIEALTDNEEGFVIVNKISESTIIDKTKYLDHAILYRTNAQSRIFEEALRRRNIPYKIYGGTSFYQRKEIKDVLAYFKLTVNKQDDEALKRIINYPKRGIGKTSIDKLEFYAREKDISLWEALKNAGIVNVGLNSRAISQMFNFATMISEFTSKISEKDAYALAKEITETSGILKDLFADKAPEAIARHENVQELLNGIREFADSEDAVDENFLDNYLESVALLTNEDNEKEEDKNKVALMTIHSAKGLEFRNVYIVGAEEKLFPSELATFSQKEVEEERRLFYVAVTRAEKELTISYSRQRYRWGQLHDCTPSRFIKDVNPSYIEFYSAFEDSVEDIKTTNASQKTNLFRGRKKYPEKKQKSINFNNPTDQTEKTIFNRELKKIDNTSSEADTNIKVIKAGVKVKHARFGNGTVVSVEGEFPNVKANIEFVKTGKKSLLLKFAKLQVLN